MIYSKIIRKTNFIRYLWMVLGTDFSSDVHIRHLWVKKIIQYSEILPFVSEC